MRFGMFWVPVALCWGSFLLIWLAGWIYGLLRGPQVVNRTKSTPLLTAGLMLLLVLGWKLHLRTVSLAFEPTWMKALGTIVLVGGTALTLWARFVLGSMWSSAPQTKADHKLMVTGPYAVCRHPIYSGMIGMFLGTLLLSELNLYYSIIAVGVSAVLVAVKAPAEERAMLGVFGDQYRAYERQVPGFIPGARWARRRPVSKGV